MQNQVSGCVDERRFDFLHQVNLFRDAQRMRRRSVNLVSSQFEIACVAGLVFGYKAVEILDSLGGMAGEW